ncbi:MAG: GntR family transcriptional regulator [Chloroflexi bacterium]|nr:GntR family transcriptional regulator [Chloroflexota bacterium]
MKSQRTNTDAEPADAIDHSTVREYFFKPLPQKALRHSVLVSLLTAVFKGQLHDGDWLNVQELAAQFGVSATPVREALVELAGIGVVEMVHNKGTVVRPFGQVQLREIYQLRRVLETEATRCACGKIEAGALDQLQDVMARLLNKKDLGWSERAMAADRQLHDLIARHCGSRRLAEEIGRYNTLVQSIRDVVGDQSSAQQRALPEHLQIIKALLEGNADGAAAAMARHIQGTAEAVEEALFPKAPKT